MLFSYGSLFKLYGGDFLLICIYNRIVLLGSFLRSKNNNIENSPGTFKIGFLFQNINEDEGFHLFGYLTN
jgi:hypothetical protein